MSQHTPTPWKLDIYGEIRDADNKALTDNKIDNEFIVRAVNEYEENKSVLTELTKDYDRLEEINRGLLEAAREALEFTEKAIAIEGSEFVYRKLGNAITQAEGKL